VIRELTNNPACMISSLLRFLKSCSYNAASALLICSARSRLNLCAEGSGEKAAPMQVWAARTMGAQEVGEKVGRLYGERGEGLACGSTREGGDESEESGTH
jgi:hypothetical protein